MRFEDGSTVVSAMRHDRPGASRTAVYRIVDPAGDVAGEFEFIGQLFAHLDESPRVGRTPGERETTFVPVGSINAGRR